MIPNEACAPVSWKDFKQRVARMHELTALTNNEVDGKGKRNPKIKISWLHSWFLGVLNFRMHFRDQKLFWRSSIKETFDKSKIITPNTPESIQKRLQEHKISQKFCSGSLGLQTSTPVEKLCCVLKRVVHKWRPKNIRELEIFCIAECFKIPWLCESSQMAQCCYSPSNTNNRVQIFLIYV